MHCDHLHIIESVTESQCSVNDGSAIYQIYDSGTATAGEINSCDHVPAIVGNVGIQHAHQRCDETLFPLPVPICQNARLNPLQSTRSAQFASKAHLAPALMKE